MYVQSLPDRTQKKMILLTYQQKHNWIPACCIFNWNTSFTYLLYGAESFLRS